MSERSLVRAVLVGLFCCALAPAQRPARLVDTRGCLWVDRHGSEWSLDGSRELLFVDPFGDGSGDATSAIAAPGGIQALPGRKCLVCGRGATDVGILEHWSASAEGRMELLSTRVDARHDYVGVFFDAGISSLFLLDASGTLLRGAWDGVAPLPSVTLSVAATPATMPALANAEDKTLAVVLGVGMCVGDYPCVGRVHGLRIQVRGTELSTAPIWGDPEGHRAYAFPVHSSEGGTVVKVKATKGVSFEIVRVGNSAVIGSGVGQGVEVLATVTTSEPLVLGERYVAREVGQPTPLQYSFPCVRRYGRSETLSDGTQLEPFFHQLGATAGGVFQVQLTMHAPARARDQAYDGCLVMALRLPHDPVERVGDRFLLTPWVTLPVRGWVPAGGTGGALSVGVPVPSCLAGEVFLVQYWVMDGSEVRVSQIYGSIFQ